MRRKKSDKHPFMKWFEEQFGPDPYEGDVIKLREDYRSHKYKADQLKLVIDQKDAWDYAYDVARKSYHARQYIEEYIEKEVLEDLTRKSVKEMKKYLKGSK